MSLRLEPDQAHYVTKVMRLDGKKKNLLRIFDGSSGEWVAQISVEGKRGQDVSVTCLEQLREQKPTRESGESDPWIIFSPLKKARLKLLLEKCTELGATRFLPILSERTDPGSLSSMDLEKLFLQIVEASEQSERLTLPILSEQLLDNDDDGLTGDRSLLKLSDLLQSWEMMTGNDRQLLICRERSAVAVPIFTCLKQIESYDCRKVAFLVGPEGGWTPEEEMLFDNFCNSSDRIQAVSLGTNILRAETAAMSAIAVYQLFMDVSSGDKGKH